ncbi:MAG: class I SAM-dependent methyltransferase [Planctomycetes bacterium]|nr:class I SAM-dependent methyltransferase [Planctomycetota bacterium]
MEDPVLVSFQTFDRQAAKLLASEAAPADVTEDRRRVEKFLFRTGRPVPNVLVLGDDLAARARQIDELGGAAVGVADGENVIALANQRYPGGHFLRGDPRQPLVDSGAFDGVWAGTLLWRIPRYSAPAALAGAHKALRPGGLLYVHLRLGDEEGFRQTAEGAVYNVRWNEQRFCEALGVLDFDRIDRDEIADDPVEVGLTFRREY